MKAPDPRISKVERLLAAAMRVLIEIKAGVPAPRRARRKRRRRYSFAGILAALREGAEMNGKSRDPRLPCAAVLSRYRRNHRGFDEKVSAILAQRPRARRSRDTGCLPGAKYDWDRIAEQIEAGASVGPATKNRQGLPSHTMIMARRKADPVFRDRVDPIIQRRRARRTHFDRDLVLQLIRGGAVIKASPPEPGMPWKDHLDRERREDPAFNNDVKAAIAFARRKRSYRRRASRPMPGPNIDWAAVLAEIEAGATIHKWGKDRRSLPSEHLIYKRRRADPIFAARVEAALAKRPAARGVWTNADQSAILEQVKRGARVHLHPPADGLPSSKVLERMRRDSPEFGTALAEAMVEGRRRRSNIEALEKLGPNEAWSLAQTAVPRTIDRDQREDIVSELIVLILSGEVAVNDDLSRSWQGCRTRLNAPRWRETSLDAPLPGVVRLTRLDFLGSDVEHL